MFNNAEGIPRNEFNINHLEPGYVILGITDNFVYVAREVKAS